MDPGRGDGARVGEVLGELLRKLGLQEEVARQEALERWDAVVGERIAAVTRATAAARGVLFVEVASSSWLAELSMMKHDILARLNAGRSEGRIERIVFTLAEEGRRGEGAERER